MPVNFGVAGAEQLLADARMQAVGADQDVACDLPAVFELQARLRIRSARNRRNAN